MAFSGSLIIEFDLKAHSYREVSFSELVINESEVHKIYWIHVDLNENHVLPPLITNISLPEEVQSLCHSHDLMPKVSDTDETVTIQIEGLSSTDLLENDEIVFGTLIIHLTDRYCFTAAKEPIAALQDFHKTFPKALRYAKTPCFILFLLLDGIVIDYSKNLFNFEILAEDLEKRIHLTHENIYNHVMDVKQEVMKVKRYTVSVREILMRISGRNISVISDQCRSSLSNLSNHTHMVVHEADSIRDLLNGLLDQIDNALMQKMNETMRVLTAFASIFLPLTLITGIYGMNFSWMPELSWKYGYFYALGLIIVCGIVLLYLFKRRKWF